MAMLICRFSSIDDAEESVFTIREYGYEEEPIDILIPEWVMEPDETWGILVPDLGRRQDIQVIDNVKNNVFENMKQVTDMLLGFNVPDRIAYSYEEKFKEGNILFIMNNLQKDDVSTVADIVREQGGEDCYIKF